MCAGSFASHDSSPPPNKRAAKALQPHHSTVTGTCCSVFAVLTLISFLCVGVESERTSEAEDTPKGNARVHVRVRV